MDVLYLMAALILGAVFLTSATAKLSDLRATYEWLVTLAVPRPELLLRCALGVEVVLPLGLGMFPRIAAGAAVIFLLGATLVLLLARDKGVGCGCFGTPRRRVSAVDFLRNFGLLSLAAFCALGSPSFETLDAAVVILGSGMIAITANVKIVTWKELRRA